MTPLKFHPDLWHQKTTVHQLSYGNVYVILHLALLVVPACDRQTDSRTNNDSVYRASTASCSKN